MGMKFVTGTVVDGKVEVPPEIEEGSRVAILAPMDGEPVILSPAQDEELSQALVDIHDGKFVDGSALLEEIKALSQA